MYRDFLIWLSYNTGRNTDLRSDAIKIDLEYRGAIKGNHKHCKCVNRGKAVNEHWNEWHCTYCLKIKK